MEVLDNRLGDLLAASLRGVPFTEAVRAALREGAMSADLLFLERWELCPLPGTAAALRVSQIRRANPGLAAAIRAELAARRG